jgi:hypothetical protein
VRKVYNTTSLIKAAGLSNFSPQLVVLATLGLNEKVEAMRRTMPNDPKLALD